MEIHDTTQSTLEKAIIGSAARQQAIAQNLANVDTPGYQRVDVDFHSTLRDAMASGGSALKDATFSPQRDASATVRADGSTVDADVEAAAQARNGLGTRRSSRSPRRASTHRSRDGPLTWALDALDASGSALSAERVRMDVTAENLANAQSTRTANGQGPYRRKEVVMQEAGAGVGTALPTPCTPPRRQGRRHRRGPHAVAPRLRPRSPRRGRQGYVAMPNVNTVTEMTDLIGASRAYEANVTAVQATKSMFARRWTSSSDAADRHQHARPAPSGTSARSRAPAGAGATGALAPSGGGSNFGSMLTDQLDKLEASRTTPPRPLRTWPPARPRTRRRSSWPSSGPACPCSSLRRCAPGRRGLLRRLPHRCNRWVLCQAMSPRAASSSPSRRWASSSSPSCSCVASAPSYTTLQAGVDPAKTGKITAALDQAGVSYKLENNGTAIAVVSGQESKARVALAGQGLSTGGTQPGYDCSTSRSSAPPPSSSQIAYQRASRPPQTIGQIDGISGASLSRCPRTTSSPTRSSPPRPCSSTPTPPLDPAAIRGIASLVSSSVPNLKPSNVTITDASGSMLWPQDGAGDAGGTGSKPAAEARYAAGMQSTLGALIARTVGSDKAQVQVHADLNVDKATQEELQYAKKGTPLETTEETESLKGTGSTGGGTAGAAANLPTYAQNAASAGELQLQAHHRQDDVRCQQDGDAQASRPAPSTSSTSRCSSTSRSRLPRPAAPAGRGRRRRDQPQARRHHDPEHGRLRQAQAARPGRPAVPPAFVTR